MRGWSFQRRARLYDRLGRVLIAGGGLGIVAAVLGIFVFIVRETAPLFQGPRVEARGVLAPPANPPALAAGVDPFREVAWIVDAAGLRFARLPGPEPLPVPEPDLGGASVTAAGSSPGDGGLALGLSDGRVLTARVEFRVRYAGGRRDVQPSVHREEEVRLFDAEPVAAVAGRRDGGRSAIAAVSGSGRVAVHIGGTRRGPPGGASAEGVVHALPGAGPGAAVALDDSGRQLALATADGQVLLYHLGGAETPPRLAESLDAGGGVTALAFLLGDQSLIVGRADGGLSTWFRAGPPGAPFRRVHRFRGHESAVTAIAASGRDKRFLSGGRSGSLALHHATSEQTFLRRPVGDGPVEFLAFAPKADGFLAAAGGGPVRHYDLEGSHPEVTWGTLFGRVWYEGYEAARHVWQSTGGTDEFEPKLSLVPLIFGTFKGTLYAMLFALPLAVLAAIYTAEFASPGVRGTVKPIVEIMASVPSVVLGFLAGLWLAPLLEHHVVGTALGLLLVPLAVVTGAWGWRRLPHRVRRSLPAKAELTALLTLTLAGCSLALWLGPALEGVFFEGGLARWLSAETALRYEQRNCLVIGFAMGFAVIPLIFSICEEALSSVPQGVRTGSLALGATRWQTAVRIVLPMALPGVLSAAMLGFGRAVGETMIVLMATGNTPILEWSIFTGMRTLAANIAVELPEAPPQETLYRVLFLSGLLLFLATFAVNTVAGEIRLRLRERYRRL